MGLEWEVSERKVRGSGGRDHSRRVVLERPN